MRLDILNDKEGVWRCRTTFNCTEACPRGIEVTQGDRRGQAGNSFPARSSQGQRGRRRRYHARQACGEWRRRRLTTTTATSPPSPRGLMSRSEKITFEGPPARMLSGIVDLPEGPGQGLGGVLARLHAGQGQSRGVADVQGAGGQRDRDAPLRQPAPGRLRRLVVRGDLSATRWPTLSALQSTCVRKAGRSLSWFALVRRRRRPCRRLRNSAA